MTPPRAPADDIHPHFARIIFAVIIALFLVRNLPWRLDDYDQAKQAFTSFEMVQEGNWWFQHTPSGRIATKPPLAGWISSALYFIMGGNWWEGAWRIPPLACALGLVALLWRSGTRLFAENNIGGLLAAGAFGLNSFTPRLATLVRTDMMLTLLIFLIGWMIWKKVRDREFWTHRDRAMLGLLVLGTMLTKGPISYAFLLPGLVLFAILTRVFKLENYSWSGVLSWFVPLLFFAGWVWVGVKLSPEFYEQVVVKEFLGRFDMSADPVHQHQPLYFYLGHLLARSLPWSLLLLALLTVRQVRAAFRTDPELLWLACWALGGLLVMSLVPSKRFDRILPVVPPLCLLLVALARHLPRFSLHGQPIGRVTILLALLACLTSGAYAGYQVVKDYANDQQALARFGGDVAERVKGREDRLVVVSGKDEGLLLYTSRPRFTHIDDALTMWRFGRIDWMVIPEPLFKKHEQSLTPYSQLEEVEPGPDRSSGYLMLERITQPESPAVPPATEEPRISQ